MRKKRWLLMKENGIAMQRTLLRVPIIKMHAQNMKRKKGNRKGRQISLNIEMEHGSVRIVQEGQHL